MTSCHRPVASSSGCFFHCHFDSFWWGSRFTHRGLCLARGKAPERFDAVDVLMAVPDKLAVAVVHPKMAGVSDLHQTVIIPSAITVNDAFNRHLVEYHHLRSQSLTVRGDLRVHLALTRKDTKHRLLKRPTVTRELALSPNCRFGIEITLINLAQPSSLSCRAVLLVGTSVQ